MRAFPRKSCPLSLIVQIFGIEQVGLLMEAVQQCRQPRRSEFVMKLSLAIGREVRQVRGELTFGHTCDNYDVNGGLRPRTRHPRLMEHRGGLVAVSSRLGNQITRHSLISADNE